MSSEKSKDSEKKSDRGSKKTIFKRNIERRESGFRIPNLPVLEYGEKCRLHEFERRMKEYTVSHFGDLCKIFTLNAYYVPPIIEIGEDLSEAEQIQLIEESKYRIKHIYDMRAKRPMLAGTIWHQLSDVSKEKVMQHADWADGIAEEDPLRLWNIIKETHSLMGHHSAAFGAHRASDAYSRLRMGDYELLVDFFENFKAAIRVMRSAGCSVPSESQQAVAFIFKLERNRYGDLQTLLKRNDELGLGTYPDTLQGAYNIVSRYSVPRSKTQSKRSDTRKLSGSTGETAFAVTDNKPKVIKCFECKQEGHMVKDCPQKKKDKKPNSNSGNKNTVMCAIDESDEDIDECAFVAVSSEQCCYAARHENDPSEDYEVHIDNQATRSIFRNVNLCSNVRKTGHFVSFTGVGGTVTTDLVGDVRDFGTVCISTLVPVNILAQHEVEDKYKVHYVCGDRFEVELAPGSRVVFRRNKFGVYVTTMEGSNSDQNPKNPHRVFMATAEENEKSYTKYEVEKAKQARELIVQMGYPSMQNLIKMAKGMINNLPVSAEDIYRAYKIYGPVLGAVKGKTKLVRGNKTVIEHIPRPVQSEVSVHIDILYISKQIPFLIGVVLPLGMTMVSYLANRTQSTLRDALNGQLKQLRSRQFIVTKVIGDGEKGFVSLRDYLGAAGIPLEVAGPNQHVPAAEVRIRVLKSLFRCTYSSLPYDLPMSLWKNLVYFVVSRMNMFPVSSREDPTPARELFLGRKVDYKKDVRIGFGEYCQIDALPTFRNSATDARTTGAISLEPVGNIQGSVRFCILSHVGDDGNMKRMKSIVTRDTWTKMTLTNEVCDYISGVAAAQRDQANGVGNGNLPEANAEAEQPGEVVLDDTNGVIDGADVDVDHVAAEEGIEPPLMHDANVEPVPIEEVEDVLPPVEPDTRRSARLSAKERIDYSSVNRVMSTLSFKKGLRKHGKHAIKAVYNELKQMVQQKVWKPVLLAKSLARKGIIIRSFMFLKEKFKPDGTFDKLKMRLVAGGNMQQKLDMDATSSPTVSLPSVLLTFTYAVNNGYYIITVDITGAYLNANMESSNVFMSIDEELVDVLAEIDPMYNEYRRGDGSIVVQLVKALYGCIESAKLWYEHLTSKLMSYGMVRSEQDECMFYMLAADGTQMDLIVAVYVDDLLICGKSKQDADKLVEFLIKEFKTITVNEGLKQAYLGMNFEAVCTETRCVRVTMEKYVEDVVSAIDETSKGIAKTPATTELFKVGEDDSGSVSVGEAKKFHSMVAKLLYLAKRARPDILTTVSYLATRVKYPNSSDIEKLHRLLKYIKGTPALGITLAQVEDTLEAFVDASHCVHDKDGKSQTGVMVTIGSGPIFVRSSKQKLVAKSSTEAELIAVSDTLPQLLWIRRLMVELKMIRDDVPVTIYEDNQSTMALIKRGKPSSESTPHITVKNFFVSDKVKSGEIKVVYVRTENQLADIFTKPLVGKSFATLRLRLGCV